jgi:hypothetical protein
MFRSATVSILVLAVFSAAAQSTITPTQQVTVANSSCAGISLGVNGSLNGFVPSPTDAWHQDISTMPVDPNSNTIMVTSLADLAGYHLHPDFGTQYGIPYNVTDSSLINTPAYQSYGAAQVEVPITVYPVDSDHTYYPVWPQAKIEGAPGQCPNDGNDRHLLVLDRNSCVAYEMYQAAYCKGNWSAAGAVMFDMLKTEQRPYGLSSVDASGLSVFEGLIRYDEILAGSINHAIRFTAPMTKANGNGGYFIAPASHAAGTLYGTDNVMGMRIRLRADFDISGYSETNQIILTAMKKYGLMLTDNGGKLFFQGTTDSRWSDSDLYNLTHVLSADLEVVQMPKPEDSTTAPTGQAPYIGGFTATQQTYQGSTFLLLHANVSTASYSFMSVPGMGNGSIFRGYMIVPVPTVTTTYTLTSRNQFGTTTASVTVTK